jgi:hypothetical protein
MSRAMAVLLGRSRRRLRADRSRWIMGRWRLSLQCSPPSPLLPRLVVAGCSVGFGLQPAVQAGKLFGYLRALRDSE